MLSCLIRCAFGRTLFSGNPSATLRPGRLSNCRRQRRRVSVTVPARAFINHVESLIDDGELNEDDGLHLISLAEALRISILN
ncbi:MAG: hypothetical protein KDA89_12895 [Planctomycetaceae bacterium]|nr:hypothetical protein [Planctomycetaceae bacterium]